MQIYSHDATSMHDQLPRAKTVSNEQ